MAIENIITFAQVRKIEFSEKRLQSVTTVKNHESSIDCDRLAKKYFKHDSEVNKLINEWHIWKPDCSNFNSRIEKYHFFFYAVLLF